MSKMAPATAIWRIFPQICRLGRNDTNCVRWVTDFCNLIVHLLLQMPCLSAWFVSRWSKAPIWALPPRDDIMPRLKSSHLI